MWRRAVGQGLQEAGSCLRDQRDQLFPTLSRMNIAVLAALILGAAPVFWADGE